MKQWRLLKLQILTLVQSLNKSFDGAHVNLDRALPCIHPQLGFSCGNYVSLVLEFIAMLVGGFLDMLYR